MLLQITRIALRNPEQEIKGGWREGGVAGGRRGLFVTGEAGGMQLDLQTGELLWENDTALRPVPDTMVQFTDFQELFERRALHCGLIQRTWHCHQVHIMNTDFDLAEWTVPDAADLGAGCPQICEGAFFVLIVCSSVRLLFTLKHGTLILKHETFTLPSRKVDFPREQCLKGSSLLRPLQPPEQRGTAEAEGAEGGGTLASGGPGGYLSAYTASWTLNILAVSTAPMVMAL